MTNQTTLTEVEKFRALETAVNGNIVERHEEVRTALIAIVSKRHHFQVGPPGTAKSLLVRTINSFIGDMPAGGHFEWLLTKYSTPEELFGPNSLVGLQEDRFERKTDGKLPQGLIVFLDEFFNANASILNALLTAMNERMFFNGTNEPGIPLMTMFGASNGTPHGEETLNALWDRLHFRHWINPVQDTTNFVQMLTFEPEVDPDPIVTVADIKEAQRQVAAVRIPSATVIAALASLRAGLKKDHGIEVSDRRWRDVLPIIQATAWWDGRDEAEVKDTRLLKHCLANDDNQRKAVSDKVMTLADPIEQEASELLENLAILSAELNEVLQDPDNNQQIMQTALDTLKKVKSAKKQKKKLREEAEKVGSQSEQLDMLDSKFRDVSNQIVECFQYEPMLAQRATDIEDD